MDAYLGGDTSIEGTDSQKCVSLQSMTIVTIADIERIIGEQFDTTAVVMAFVNFCRQLGRKSWNLKALHLIGDSAGYKTSGDGGFKALVGLLEEGYLNDICDLRFGLGDGITGSSMGRFRYLFQSGHLDELRILHFHLCFRQRTRLSLFWMEFRKSLSRTHLTELQIQTVEPGGDFHEPLISSRYVENGLFASGHLRSLRVLRLSRVYLGNQGMILLAEEFHSGHASELESLELTSNEIGIEGTRSLADALGSGHLGSLRVLDLSDNSSEDEGVVSLANSFQNGCASMLQALNLSHNKIGTEGIKCLAVAFECGRCPKLRSLNLKGNYSTNNEGLVALAKAFKSGHLSDLEVIHLPGYFAGNRKAARAMVEIASALEVGSVPHLKMINLFAEHRFSDCPVVVKDALENSYRRNPYLFARFWELDVSVDMSDPWVERMNNFRRSNEERVHRLKVLEEEEDVVGQHGKVFFCGDPRVGKTSLKITLSAGMATKQTMLMNKTFGLSCGCLAPPGPEPTRGIEVTNVQSEGTTLALWDLAGQHDYHVLHSAFLPDLNFAGGQATFFVIVCDARSFEQAKTQLEYWMRFISSNSVQDTEVDRRRRVFVVLNCFHGHRITQCEIPRWKNFLTECEKCFGMYLNLCKEPFIVSVISTRQVQSIKSTILKEAEEMLQRRKMPKICLSVQEQGREWVKSHKNAEYPVLTWHEFRNLGGNGLVEERKLEAAAEYLHEAGHIILFRKSISSSALEGEVLTSQGGLVIVDQEWFCKHVVGNLLLPKDIASRAEDKLEVLQEEEGVSIPISTLTKTEFKVPPSKIDEVVIILSRLGICYQIEDRPNDIFVPALIEELDVPGWSMEPWGNDIGTGAWVMGFSLKVKNLTATLLPINVLRKLQVNIAVERSIGRRHDYNYLARKFSISFQFKDMYVLIEYSAKKQDRIDILVKPAVENFSRKQQINVAQEFVNRIVETVKDCARGVELDKRIIRPWSVSQGWMPIEERVIEIRVDSLITHVEDCGMLQMMGWRVEGKLVGEDDVLSDEDLWSFLNAISKKLELTKHAVNCLSDSNIEKLGKGEGASSASETSSVGFAFANFKHEDTDIQAALRHVCLHMEKLVGQVLGSQRDMEERIHAHLVELRKDVKGNINTVLAELRSLHFQIQNLERFSIGQRELSVPRFVYVTKKGERDLWMKLTGGAVETLVLRFLCEAKYETGGRDMIGRCHEVNHQDQEGVDVRKIPDWARKLLPKLVWTLKFIFVSAKIVGNIFLPSFGILFGNDQELSNILNKITQMTPGVADLCKYLFEGLDVAIKRSLLSNSGMSVKGGSSGSTWVPGTETQLRGGAREALRKVLDGMEDAERERQVGLRRVWMETADSGGKKHIVWICKECYERYMNHSRPRAHDV